MIKLECIYVNHYSYGLRIETICRWLDKENREHRIPVTNILLLQISKLKQQLPLNIIQKASRKHRAHSTNQYLDSDHGRLTEVYKDYKHYMEQDQKPVYWMLILIDLCYDIVKHIETNVIEPLTTCTFSPLLTHSRCIRFLLCPQLTIIFIFTEWSSKIYGYATLENIFKRITSENVDAYFIYLNLL